MKIGILTHPLDYNYGCLLQAFALQKTLKSMGHEVVAIDRFSNPKVAFFSQLKNWMKRIAAHYVKGTNVCICWNPNLTMDMKRTLCSKTQKFVDRNITNTGIVFPSDLKMIDEEYQFDAYVVGSDQVWLPHFSLNCFLDFVERDNVKRIFYAASTGSTSFADVPSLAMKCKNLSRKFSGISVREDSLLPVVKKTLGRDAIQVLDPTLLLDAKDYLAACIEKEDDSPIIFTYILDKTDDKQVLVDKVQKELHLPIVAGSVENDYKRGKRMDINKCIYPSVDHWILNMARAKFVVTDSFHGTCMAITFRKPFVVVGNKARGLNRFLSVLRLFNLENRLITDSTQFCSFFFSQLNNDSISELLEKKRKEAFDYIKININKQ